MKNLKQASKASILKSKQSQAVANKGISKDSVNTTITSTVEAALGEFIQKVIQNISDKGVIDTGNITNITVESTDLGWSIKAPEYLIYQSWGVNGTEQSWGAPFSYKPGIENRPSPRYFVEWARRKGFENPESAAFGIANNLQKGGIQPKNLYQAELDELVQTLGPELSKNILETLDVNITKDINIK